jgi:type I restriction enzyme S subunit
VIFMTELGKHIKTQKGFAFKNKWYSDSGAQIVKVSDFTKDSVDSSNLTFIPKEIAKDYQRYILRQGDVVIQTVGSWPSNPKSVVGKVIRVPGSVSGSLLNQNAVRLDPSNDLDKSYMFYLLKWKSFKNYIIGCAQGSASQASITLDDIRKFSFNLPPISTQRKIAVILSAYDDLIENNTRRIQILEEIAQAVYREWFVYFRFPGHEGVRMVETPLGLIPEGWEVADLGDIVSYLNRGISPKYDEKSDLIVINQRCIRDNKINLEPARRHSTNYSTEKAVKFGDVLINSTGIGTLGRVAQVYQDLENHTIDSHVTFARPNNRVLIDYFGACLLGLQSYFDHMGTGATGQTELSRQSIASAKILLPPMPLQTEYGLNVASMRKASINYQERNAVLRQTRDLLLPKLVSGEVAVPK